MRLITTLSLFITLFHTASADNTDAAREVMERFAGQPLNVSLSINLSKVNGCDRFEYEVTDGALKINGSSGVALCRAFYDYVRNAEAGIASWSGTRCQLPQSLPSAPPTKVTSPYPHHYYFNVVTFGYTMPYWDWNRWEKEIDWMALHGIDMPLALVANEAISARVWRKLGLTDEEINDYFVGPAHFPWMRMGNISGIDGPLPESWHKAQIELQHKILLRMKALGMKPICPGFAGFVPETFSRLFPDNKLIETSWSDGKFHNWMIDPASPLFKQVGSMFIEEWEKEFGKNGYYIADSFNEMEIPFPEKGTAERYNMLADYGCSVYESIQAGNPDAVWVMQGWMFGYQRNIWDQPTLQALLSKVPDDKMLLLDLAVDYNECFWKNGNNWDFYQGFFNKPWVYSVIPNMGGKNGLTGILEFYANGRMNALNSRMRGRLSGYGMAPEGLENNEVIYELVADGGWTAEEINLSEWLRSYSKSRYGKHSESVDSFWNEICKSAYGSFTDHPRFSWQFRPGTVKRGSIKADQHYYKAIETLASAVPEMECSPLFIADMTEMTAHYLGGKMERLLNMANASLEARDTLAARQYETRFIELGLEMDRLLYSHPTMRLENWIAKARGNGKDTTEADYYEKNARRIVTVWGPPVDDYSARIWSGLIRDYYMPRWKNYFDSRHAGKEFDFSAWELDWVENQKGLSEQKPFDNQLQACRRLIHQTMDI